MAEKYVSVSELRKLLGITSDGQCTGCQFSTVYGCKDDSIQRACEAIDDAPEADVRPVVHRSWIVTDHGDYQLIECDQCHAQMWNHQSELPNYCYECGADMRKLVEIDQVKEAET